MEDNVINYTKANCGELLTKKELSDKSILLDNIQIGNRYQFYDDRNRVREVLEIDEEYILIQTLGCTEDLPYYKCHYTHLKINETQVEELK